LKEFEHGMREIFEDIFINQPLDPNESARRSMRGPARHRFYDRARAAEGALGYYVLLDGKPVRTPARSVLASPTMPLAEAIAHEWEAQRGEINPGAMPLTRLANSVIDGVAAAPEAVAREIAQYLGSDLVCYRAAGPQELIERQAQHWDPVLAWAREALRARFVLAQGVVFVEQPEAALAAARDAIPIDDPWRLGALASITTLTGSALLALALAAARLSLEEAWAAAHVDEDWNIDTWGRDESALQRRAHRFADMQAAAEVLKLA
jgi:chaperone required for assembly of F1-ATPase